MVFIIIILLFIVPLALMVLSRRYKKYEALNQIAFIMLLPYMALVISFFAFVGYILIHQIQLPSRVDVSPLSYVTDEQLELTEIVALQLEYHPMISRGRGAWGNRQYNMTSYSLLWESTSVASLTIRMAVYDDDLGAIRSMEGWRRPGRGLFVENRRRFREVIYDNNTQAILEHCVNNYSIPRRNRAGRFFRSSVRIGNVVFSLSEARPRNDRDNNYSSQFIALFVELLQEVELARYDE